MKKNLALLMALVMLFSLSACSESETTATESTATETTAAPVETAAEVSVANPVQDFADLSALLAAQPTIQLNDAPVGATDVTYSVINNIPAISQITFNYNGSAYVYRAAFGTESEDISGVYTALTTVTAGKVEIENMAGGTYTLRYDPTTGEAVAVWGSSVSGCHYSLYSKDACKGGTSAFEVVLNGLFTCAMNIRNATGTVNAVMNSTLVVTLEDGSSVVLDCSNVSKLTLAAKDIISFSYIGDLKGTAYLVAAAKTGVAEDTATFSGTVIKIDTDSIFVCTQDNNVFYFDTKNATIGGKATTLSLYQAITVTYTGDLYGSPVAVSIEITNATPVSPTPSPSATPTPVNRHYSGMVTSVAGNYVTLNGVCFDITGKNYSSYVPTVGCNADIYFTDYGNYKFVVTSAYFDAPTPQSYSTTGTVTSVNKADGNNWYFTINGIYIHLNTRACGGDGSLEVGSWGTVEYVISNGMNEATYATFTAPEPTPTPEIQYYYLYGEVVSVGWADDNHIYFILSSGAQFKVAVGAYNMTPEPGYIASGTYYIDSSTGEYVCTYVEFSFTDAGNGEDAYPDEEPYEESYEDPYEEPDYYPDYDPEYDEDWE